MGRGFFMHSFQVGILSAIVDVKNRALFQNIYGGRKMKKKVAIITVLTMFALNRAAGCGGRVMNQTMRAVSIRRWS